MFAIAVGELASLTDKDSIDDKAERQKSQFVAPLVGAPMPPATRTGHQANNPVDAHGKPCCPHNVTGPAVAGSPNVYLEGCQMLRIGDPGVHSTCCGPNTWVCAAGSPNVFINNIPAVRLGDATTHCGGTGSMITGSSHVFINGG